MLSEILVLCAILFNCALLLLMIRNNKVHEYRIAIINEVYSDPGSFLFPFKHAEYKSISYNKMMFQFWRPVDSFYPTLGKKEK